MTTVRGTVTSTTDHRCPQKAKIELDGEDPFWKRCILPVNHSIKPHLWVEEENSKGQRLIVQWTGDGGTVVNYERTPRQGWTDDMVHLREHIVREIMAFRATHWQRHLREHPHSDASSCPADYAVHDALYSAAGIARTTVYDPEV